MDVEVNQCVGTEINTIVNIKKFNRKLLLLLSFRMIFIFQWNCEILKNKKIKDVATMSGASNLLKESEIVDTYLVDSKKPRCYKFKI